LYFVQLRTVSHLSLKRFSRFRAPLPSGSFLLSTYSPPRPDTHTRTRIPFWIAIGGGEGSGGGGRIRKSILILGPTQTTLSTVGRGVGNKCLGVNLNFDMPSGGWGGRGGGICVCVCVVGGGGG
jgi:hypothetical protein